MFILCVYTILIFGAFCEFITAISFKHSVQITHKISREKFYALKAFIYKAHSHAKKVLSELN